VRCFVVAGFLLTSASRGPSAIAEPLVYYGSESCPISRSHELVFAICVSFMNIDIVCECMKTCSVQTADCAINRHKCKFLQNIYVVNQCPMVICCQFAESELKHIVSF